MHVYYIMYADRLQYFQLRTVYTTELFHINFIELNAIYEK